MLLVLVFWWGLLSPQTPEYHQTYLLNRRYDMKMKYSKYAEMEDIFKIYCYKAVSLLFSCLVLEV